MPSPEIIIVGNTHIGSACLGATFITDAARWRLEHDDGREPVRRGGQGSGVLLCAGLGGPHATTL